MSDFFANMTHINIGRGHTLEQEILFPPPEPTLKTSVRYFSAGKSPRHFTLALCGNKLTVNDQPIYLTPNETINASKIMNGYIEKASLNEDSWPILDFGDVDNFVQSFFKGPFFPESIGFPKPTRQFHRHFGSATLEMATSLRDHIPSAKEVLTEILPTHSDHDHVDHTHEEPSAITKPAHDDIDVRKVPDDSEPRPLKIDGLSWKKGACGVAALALGTGLGLHYFGYADLSPVRAFGALPTGMQQGMKNVYDSFPEQPQMMKDGTAWASKQFGDFQQWGSENQQGFSDWWNARNSTSI